MYRRTPPTRRSPWSAFAAPLLAAPLLAALLLLAAGTTAAEALGPAVPLTDEPATTEHPAPPCAILCPGNPSAFGAVPSFLTPLGERLFFVAGDLAHGGEPWITDGTVEGTQRLGDLCPGDCSSLPIPILALERPAADPLLFFWASTPAEGREPWVTDGTAAGTHLLADLCPGICDSAYADESFWVDFGEESSTSAAVMGGEVYFGVLESEAAALYASDGTTAGTRRVAAVCEGFCYVPLKAITRSGSGDHLFFAARREFGVSQPFRLWESDGTAAGTREVDLGCAAGEGETASKILPFGDGVAVLGGCVDPSWAVQPEVLLLADDGSVRHLGLEEAVDVTLWHTRLWVLRGALEAESHELWVTTGEPEQVEKRLDLGFATSRIESSFERLYLFARPPAPLHGAGSLFVTTGYEPPVRVSEGPVSAGSPFVEAGGRALWWEDPAPPEGDGRHWELVSHSPRSPRRVEQAMSAPAEAPNGAPQVDLAPRMERVGSTLFLGANGGEGEQLWRLPVAALEPDCFADLTAHCLRGGRFEVRVHFTDQHNGGEGTATPEDLSRAQAGDTGYFWFFREENLELAVKVLDGRPVNGHWWVFSGGTTDLGYELEVRDRVSGETRLYVHAPGDLCSVVDTAAFAEEPPAVGAALGVETTSTSADATPVSTAPASTAPATGVAAPLTPPPPPECDFFGGRLACVGPADRFSIQVDYVNQHAGGVPGPGYAFPETADTATVRFFPNAGTELLVKVLDGRPVNGHWWVLWGGLTNLGYTVRVLDRETEEVRTFTNPPGSQCGGAATTAFAEAP